MVSPSSSQNIELVHYGKVRLAPSTGIPYRILEASGSHCDGTCIHGLLTDVTLSASWSVLSVTDRTATINGPIVSGKHYHVVLNIDDDPMSPVQHLETNDLFGGQRDIPTYEYVIGTQ